MRKILVVFALLACFVTQADAQSRGHRWFIPYNDFNRVPGSDVMAAGSAITAEISTFGVSGIPMATADLAALTTMWPTEYHNNLYPVAVRIIWASDSAGDDGSIDFLFSIEEKSFGAQSALEAATVAMADDIAFAAETSNVQFGVQATAWDSLGVVAMSTYNGETLVQMMVELNDEGDTASDEVHLLGVEIFFVPPDFKGANFYVPGSTAQAATNGIALPRRAGF